MIHKKEVFIYFNEEWNNERATDDDGGDEDHIDGVDEYHKKEVDTRYYDDYEDYGY